jgi:hypothetical protein
VGADRIWTGESWTTRRVQHLLVVAAYAEAVKSDGQLQGDFQRREGFGVSEAELLKT